MDINKYIGKFLIKNKYCSLTGLGVFDLKKEAARPNSANETISAPVYVIKFTPVGSIDDTFASFIASAENVSISNASNNIKEYCNMVKNELAKTGKYDIEFLGTFSLSNNKISFQQSSALDLGTEPAPLPPLIDKSKSPEGSGKTDYSYPPANRKREVPILKIMVPAVLLILLLTAAYFGYDYYQNNKASEESFIPETSSTHADTMETILDTTGLHASNLNRIDSTNTTDTSLNTVSPASVSGGLYNVVVLSYENEGMAIAKANKLKNYGNNASVSNRDGRFLVVIHASAPMNDTNRLVDSLRRFYNPKGPVFIMK